MAYVLDDERYMPENWIPHCSLATHCPVGRVLDAVAVCLRLSLPLDGRVAEVGVITTGPARPQFTYVLRLVLS